MVDTKIVLRCKDKYGNTIIFERANYDKHRRKHPELEDPIFFPEHVKKALKTPTVIAPAYKTNGICYYYEEYAIKGIIKYTKVVIMKASQFIDGKAVFVIKTAYKTDHIQETKYPELKIEYF